MELTACVFADVKFLNNRALELGNMKASRGRPDFQQVPDNADCNKTANFSLKKKKIKVNVTERHC